ncbi:MAG: hypothetical protein LBV51_05465 [Acholeplasmatales bacterium]|jgi:hypothetical protein|nr:hypothetical protein [Acholeplasmatales bacterium]
MKKLFLLLFSCLLLVSVSSCGTIKSGFGGSDKPLPVVHFEIAYKLNNKAYKVGDKVVIKVSSGSEHYYEKTEGGLEYVAKSNYYINKLGELIFHNEPYYDKEGRYTTDPYDNFAYQIFSGDTVYAYHELPNFRSYTLSATPPKPVTKEWHWVFSNSDEVTLTVNKEMIEKANGRYTSLEIRLVSYKDKEELNAPIHNIYMSQIYITGTNIYYHIKNNKVIFSAYY